MEKRLGVVGIVIENPTCVEKVNAILHEFSTIIVARLGLPYRERGVAVISIVVDGTNDRISALTGQLGKIKDVTVKAAITKTSTSEPS